MQSETYTLKNGLRVVLVDTQAFPSLTTLLFVGAGSRYENKKNNGIAHFFEHMAFKGTPWIGTRDFEREMEIVERIDSVAVAYTELMASIPQYKKDRLSRLEKSTIEALRASDTSYENIDAAVALALADTLRENGERFEHLEQLVQAKQLRHVC